MYGRLLWRFCRLLVRGLIYADVHGCLCFALLAEVGLIVVVVGLAQWARQDQQKLEAKKKAKVGDTCPQDGPEQLPDVPLLFLAVWPMHCDY